MKKMLALLLIAVMALSLTACGSSNSASNTTAKKKIGISMPTKSTSRWIADGENIVKQLQAKGYETDLQYGEDNVENQLAQIENMITKGANVLIIAPIDGESLTTVLQKAKDKNIPVIAYDRLIKKTDNVDYYATFDNFKVGVIQASYLEEALGLKEGKGPFNIEIFGGSPDDNNAFLLFDGAMSVLKPYIDAKKLVVKSGQMDMSVCSTLRWDGATAQARMDNLLSKNYTGDKLDAVFSSYDGLSIGILSSLKAVGYGTPSLPMPLVTGQDAELPSVKSIIKGEQSQTVFKDTRELAKVAVEMVDAVLSGQKAKTNDEKTYNNGVKVVPSYLLVPVSVDKRNYEKVLIESGYYTPDQLK